MPETILCAENDDQYTEPPNLEAPTNHIFWPEIRSALASVFDPEIPVNIFELGLIYLVKIQESADKYDIYVQMSLTSPGCPVAQEMPIMVQSAITPLKMSGNVEIDLVWDPPWDPTFMAETAKIQLNMF